MTSQSPIGAADCIEAETEYQFLPTDTMVMTREEKMNAQTVFSVRLLVSVALFAACAMFLLSATPLTGAMGSQFVEAVSITLSGTAQPMSALGAAR